MPTINLKVPKELIDKKRKLGKTWMQIILDGMNQSGIVNDPDIEKELTAAVKHLVAIRNILRKDTPTNATSTPG